MMKKSIDSKVYRELYEIIEVLSYEEKDKIPQEIIDNIKTEMDNEYVFEIDKNKSLLEQDLLPETQALLIKLYEKYLASDEEKEKWILYDKMCYSKLQQRNDSLHERNNKLSKNNDTRAELTPKQELIESKKEKFIEKLFQKIKSFFR